ncbi:MAG: hypothetical protein ACLFVT_04985 [Syntrophobacteria bacterium]
MLTEVIAELIDTGKPIEDIVDFFERQLAFIAEAEETAGPTLRSAMEKERIRSLIENLKRHASRVNTASSL